MDSSEPQDDAMQISAWPFAEQTDPPTDQEPQAEQPAPSWQGYQPEPTDYARHSDYSPNPPGTNGYSVPPAEHAPGHGTADYAAPPAHPGEYQQPTQPGQYAAQPQHGEYQQPPAGYSVSPDDYSAPPAEPAAPPAEHAPPPAQQAAPTEHAAPPAEHAPMTNGYLPPPPPAPEGYTAPPQFVQPSPDVPAGAGMVPPRSDALPPAPGQAPDHASAAPQPPATGWSVTDYRGGAYTEPQPQPAYPPAPHSAHPAQPPHPDPNPPAPNRPVAAPAPATPPAAGSSATPAWQPTGAAPKPEDLLVPDLMAIADEPARWGWRGRVNRLSGGAVNAKAKAAELADRKALRDIQRGFSRPMTVVVIQPKGGAGKTPTTIGIAAALGVHRGGYVVGWDDNETRGTLAVRVVNRDSQRATVWDLLSELPRFERTEARVGDLSYYVRAQGEAQFDALVSDDLPSNMEQIGEQEFHRIHAVLQRFYRVVVIDTGNNVRSPNWQAAVNAADVVVIPSTYQRDVGFSASWVLDHLIQTGREELAEHAVTVLTAADPSTDPKVREELLHHFSARTEQVVEIPYDPHIATGGPIHWDRLNDVTRRAWVQAAAVVVMSLIQRDEAQRQLRQLH